MANEKESSNSEEMEIYEEFPYPKLIKLFDFYFPKTKGHEKINWRRMLKVWAKWAPWIAIFLMILIVFFIRQDNVVAYFAFVALIVSFVNFAYFLVLAGIAKLVKRSPRILLALTPRAAIICVFLLSIGQLLHYFSQDKSLKDDKKVAQQERVNRIEERAKTPDEFSILGRATPSTPKSENPDPVQNSKASNP